MFLAFEGKTDSNEYFLLEGLIQRNIINSEGESVTTGFYMPFSVLTPHFARTIAGKSIFNLQTLSDVTIAELPVKTFDSLRYSNDDIRTFGQKVLEKELQKSLAHEVAYRSMTAKDRILTLRKEYPNIENIIPHSIIASYIGVTPVSFSRLRNELAKE